MCDTIEKMARRLATMIDDFDDVSRVVFKGDRHAADGDDGGDMIDGGWCCRDEPNDDHDEGWTCFVQKREDIRDTGVVRDEVSNEYKIEQCDQNLNNEEQGDEQDDLLSQYLGIGRSKTATSVNQSQYMLVVDDKSCHEYLRDDLSHISMKADQCSFYSIKSSTWQPSAMSKPQTKAEEDLDHDYIIEQSEKIKKPQNQKSCSNESILVNKEIKIHDADNSKQLIKQDDPEVKESDELNAENSKQIIEDNTHFIVDLEMHTPMSFTEKVEYLGGELKQLVRLIQNESPDFSFLNLIEVTLDSVKGHHSSKRLYMVFHEKAGLITASLQGIKTYTSEIFSGKYDNVLNIVSPLTSIEISELSRSSLDLKQFNSGSTCASHSDERSLLPCEVVVLLLILIANIYDDIQNNRLTHHLSNLLTSAKMNHEASIMTSLMNISISPEPLSHMSKPHMPHIHKMAYIHIDSHRAEIRASLLAYISHSTASTSTGTMTLAIAASRLPGVIESIIGQASAGYRLAACNYRLVAMIAGKRLHGDCMAPGSTSLSYISSLAEEADVYCRDMIKKFEDTAKHSNAMLFVVVLLTCCRIVSKDAAEVYESLIQVIGESVVRKKEFQNKKSSKVEERKRRAIDVVSRSDTTVMMSELRIIFDLNKK